jgi:hypothetical protein
MKKVGAVGDSVYSTKNRNTQQFVYLSFLDELQDLQAEIRLLGSSLCPPLLNAII